MGIDCFILASSEIEWLGLSETLKSTRRRIFLCEMATSSMNFMGQKENSLSV